MIYQLAPDDKPAGYGEGIVSLEDLKAHVSVLADDTEFDALLPLLRDAAVDMVERYCGVRLSPCAGLVWQAEGLPHRVSLGVRPVVEVTGFSYLDSTNAPQTLAVDKLRIAAGGELRPVPGETWPGDIAAGVEITFDAGFTDANRPAALVHAVKMFAAHLFVNREAVVTGTIATDIPLGFQMLCAPFRPVVV